MHVFNNPQQSVAVEYAKVKCLFLNLVSDHSFCVFCFLQFFFSAYSKKKRWQDLVGPQ